MRTNLRSILTTILLATATTHAEPPAAPSGPPPDRKWKLVFSDEFDGTAIDETKWKPSDTDEWKHPGLKTRQEPKNCALDGQGHLVIRHNTALNFEFAEAPERKDGVDCVDASSDKELRRSHVEIIESTAARVHVRWTAQPCGLNYKVWGESAAEDFYFYPDGFGTRTMTLQCEPKAQYEIEELLIITPPAAYPLRVLPANLVDVLFRDGTKRELKFPILDQERDYEKLLSGDLPPLYRIRFNAFDAASAIYFNPGWTRLPGQAYRPFYSQGQMVTPFHRASACQGRRRAAAIAFLQRRTPRHAAVRRRAGRLAHDHPGHALHASRLRASPSPEDACPHRTQRTSPDRPRLRLGWPHALAQHHAARRDKPAADVQRPIRTVAFSTNRAPWPVAFGPGMR